MNVFVLNSGRCGSSSFIAACKHITNYSAGHESRLALTGLDRLAYPDHHIEADNRLSWLLGRLDQAYGNSAFYVHLSRAPQAVVESFVRRQGFGIMQAYRDGILLGGSGQMPEELAEDYLATVEANIRLFLRDKSHWIPFRLEQAGDDFRRFWQEIGAEGDLDAALESWSVPHNTSAEFQL